MKKLLALSIALLSLNLYGAEKPIPSKTGLEGWGKKEGVSIVVEDYSRIDKTYDMRAIKNQVELKLRLAGIKISQRFSDDYIHINMMPIRQNDKVIGYTIQIKTRRDMTFKYNGKEYRATADSSQHGGLCSIDYRLELDKHLDKLLINYLKANPKAPLKKAPFPTGKPIIEP